EGDGEGRRAQGGGDGEAEDERVVHLAGRRLPALDDDELVAVATGRVVRGRGGVHARSSTASPPRRLPWPSGSGNQVGRPALHMWLNSSPSAISAAKADTSAGFGSTRLSKVAGSSRTSCMSAATPAISRSRIWVRSKAGIWHGP